MAEVLLAQGGICLIQSSRLTPGDSTAARHAFCAYNAGLPPANGEVLRQVGRGSMRVVIRNNTLVSSVVKFRRADLTTVLALFLAPGSEVDSDSLPEGGVVLDYATGELWSRACGMFAAGMRSQRIATMPSARPLTRMTIPYDPAGAVVPIDISEETFALDR
jgi:hypothetical protein